jgi:mRNA-degrading endonuclease RelE of RelBE toxin-antitoxin system
VQVERAIDELSEDPFAGDVVPIKSGSFEGALRKRVGRYRIIYSINQAAKLVEIAAILPRSEQTYR